MPWERSPGASQGLQACAGPSLALRQEEAGLRPAIPATGPGLQPLSLGSCSYQPDSAFGLGPAHWPHLKLSPAWSCTSQVQASAFRHGSGPHTLLAQPWTDEPFLVPRDSSISCRERAHPSCRDPERAGEPQQWCYWVWCEQQALQFSRNLCVCILANPQHGRTSPWCPTICKTRQRPKS